MAAWEKKDESRKRTMNSWGRGDVEREGGGGGGGGGEGEGRGRKGAEGTPGQEGETADGERRIEKDEEGDHGSIVAFRIPCRPSVDFRPLPSPSLPPSPLLRPLRSPSSTTTADLHPLQLASSFRALHHLCLRYPLPSPPHPPRAIPRLARSPRPSSRTCIVDVHASLRRPRLTDQTLFSPHLSFLHPRSSWRVSLPFFPFRPLFLSLSLYLLPLFQPSRRRRAKLA